MVFHNPNSCLTCPTGPTCLLSPLFSRDIPLYLSVYLSVNMWRFLFFPFHIRIPQANNNNKSRHSHESNSTFINVCIYIYRHVLRVYHQKIERLAVLLHTWSNKSLLSYIHQTHKKKLGWHHCLFPRMLVCYYLAFDISYSARDCLWRLHYLHHHHLLRRHHHHHCHHHHHHYHHHR